MAEKITYSIKGYKLLLPNGNMADIKNPITKVELFGKVLVVHFNRKTKIKGRANVCGVDPVSGTILWMLKGKQRVHDKKLLLEDGKVVSFKEPITQAVICGEVLVLLFNQEKPNPCSKSEICGVDSNCGKILWRRNGKRNDAYTELQS